MRLVIGIVLAVAAQLGSATQVFRGKQTSLTHQHAATHAMHTLHKLHGEPEESKEESAEQVMSEQKESEEKTDASEEETTDASEEETTDASEETTDDLEENTNKQREDAGYGDASEGEDAIDHDAAVSDDSTKFEFKFAKKGEKHWHVPNMKPLGFFKGVAGLNKDGLNQTLLDSTFQPTMIPIDGFAIRAATPLEKNDTGVSPFTPKLVEHGELKIMRKKEDNAENSEVDDEIKSKTEMLRSEQAAGACALMETALTLARAAREEEEAAKGEGHALVNIVKTICPALKYQYSFVMKCKKCDKMEARLEKFYDVGFDSKVFPGLSHPDKCDKGNWPTKNFALEAALSSTNLFFGVDFCEAQEDQEDEEDEGGVEEALL